ncbi:biotin--[acetyl-CoA-carboxylase] ligase [Yimella sp. RIT 621]|uniref:biotin--[acetyl-CoA-carboxylase] ligase n=1 Tax=Yimella sp. RIT 621 TaxID=2510323 RepID=UPI001F0D1B09|nr:biotin--[acetyl-CoA-carboxylase] ligase [Yimella sp. RIT 621]
MAPVLESERLRRDVPSPPWNDVEVLGSVDSTNAVLGADPRPWRVVVADHQSAGRGRLDRQWHAPHGSSIALSATLPLPDDPRRWGWVPLLVGLCVRTALSRLTHLDVGLKWPNDILVCTESGTWRKLGGILCEATGGEHPGVIVGIGLNVWQNESELPSDAATSLSINGVYLDREPIIVAILDELAEIQKVWGTSNLDDDYRAACVTVGQHVKVSTAHAADAEGVAVDIDESGRLVLEQSDGARTPHAVGDVVHVRPAMPPASDLRPVDRARFVDRIEEQLLHSPRTLRRADVSELAGVDSDFPRRLWRALGFANARDEDVVFNERDVEAVRRMVEMVGQGLINEQTAIGIARAVGRSTDRMAMWTLQLISDMMLADEGFEVDTERAADVAERMVAVADHLVPLVEHVTRRNVANSIARMVADAEPESHVGVVRTVGFADLVDFTKRVRSMSERDLALLVIRFETLASDVVAQAGGAVVKTVGDEVLFTHRTISGGVQIAFDLLAAVEADPLLRKIRIGVATGRVLARQGDIYGNTVNRASRLTALAASGEVLVDEDVADAMRKIDGVDVFAAGPTQLAGVGEVNVSAVSRTGSHTHIHEELNR